MSGVDTSLAALELANENVVINNMDPEKISFSREDATAFMKSALSRNESWDIVIIDPPKLAPSKKVWTIFSFFLDEKKVLTIDTKEYIYVAVIS